MNTEATSPRPDRSTDWYLDHLAADVDRFASAIERGPTDAPIAACPGWDALRLAEHLGQIHRWARFCVEHARPPTADDAPIEPFAPERAGPWLRDGADELIAVLRAVGPDEPTWHPFPMELVTRVWPRRQAHETAMHRWDVEHATGVDARIDPELASDGIDEYFEIAIPRLIVREALAVPEGSLHVHCTDVEGEWLVWSERGEYRMIREHQKGDAALRGPAAALLLRLWGRSGADDAAAAELAPIGDEGVLDAWLALSGM